MTINITTKNFELSQTTKENVIIPAMDKLDNLIGSADIIVAKEGRRIIVKIKTEAYNTKINATGEEVRLVTALSEAIDITKRKIRKAKTHDQIKSKQSSLKPLDVSDRANFPSIISTDHLILDTMSDDEAIYNAEMSDHNMFHYRDEAGSLAVIIKRNNGFSKITIE